MKIKNTKNETREIFKTNNKYQATIILLVLVPCVLIFLSFIGIVLFGNLSLSKMIMHSSSFPGIVNFLNRFSVLLVLLICSLVLLSLIEAFIISHHMLGAFNRIIFELDEIIARRSQKALTCRPQDELMSDLLKRVNVLVKVYAENKPKKQDTK